MWGEPWPPTHCLGHLGQTRGKQSHEVEEIQGGREAEALRIQEAVLERKEMQREFHKSPEGCP